MTSLTNELLLHAEDPPIRVDEGGAVRVGNSRVSLDLVVEQYENGMTPGATGGLTPVPNYGWHWHLPARENALSKKARMDKPPVAPGK